MSKSNRSLKNFLIFPSFQMTLVIMNLFVMTINFGVIYFSIIDSFNHVRSLAESFNIPEYSAFYQVLNGHQEFLLSRITVAAIIIYVMCFLITIYVSHKVAGPIYNLKNFFLHINDHGEVGQLHFRKNDYYGELPSIINQAVAKLQGSQAQGTQKEPGSDF